MLLTSQICHFVFYSKLPSPFKCAKSAKPLRKLRIFSLCCSSFSISYNFRKAGEIANYKKNSKEEKIMTNKKHMQFISLKWKSKSCSYLNLMVCLLLVLQTFLGLLQFSILLLLLLYCIWIPYFNWFYLPPPYLCVSSSTNSTKRPLNTQKNSEADIK